MKSIGHGIAVKKKSGYQIEFRSESPGGIYDVSDIAWLSSRNYTCVKQFGGFSSPEIPKISEPDIRVFKAIGLVVSSNGTRIACYGVSWFVYWANDSPANKASLARYIIKIFEIGSNDWHSIILGQTSISTPQFVDRSGEWTAGSWNAAEQILTMWSLDDLSKIWRFDAVVKDTCFLSYARSKLDEEKGWAIGSCNGVLLLAVVRQKLDENLQVLDI